MKILHLEDDSLDAALIERSVERDGIPASFIRARCASEFLQALKTQSVDVVLVDNGVPSYGAREAIAASKAHLPHVPVIVCSGAARESDVAAALAAGATDFVLKDHLWQLSAALRRSAERVPAIAAHPNIGSLIKVIEKLSLARGLDAIVDIVRRAARELTGADGATFVLRDGEYCYYVDESAISPLWKGQRFPLESCISGWAMLNGSSTVIADIYSDPRIPHDAYRPTFVKSLAMVPIRSSAPIGAIGNYWATAHECTPEELALLEALANSTSVAIENVNIYQSLEERVRERTRELQSANQELEAFTYAVSHDLRAPLRAMSARLAQMIDAGTSDIHVEELRRCTERMSDMINDLLRLARIGRTELMLKSVDIASVVRSIMDRLRALEPSRAVELSIAQCEKVIADEGLLTIALENLLGNAWKYSAKMQIVRIAFSCAIDEDGRQVFTIRDNGTGFDPAYHDRLFQPFCRLHSAEEFPGVGIGLATVDRIVKRHGGKIWAQSDGISGASFSFTLS